MGFFDNVVQAAKNFVEDNGYYCSVCKKTITAREYEYSTDKFKRALCRYHQKNPSHNRKKSPKTYSKIKKSTPEARELYYALKQRGVPAELEKWDGYKHIDIAVTHAMVNIEVDGGHHNYSYKQALADLKRTFYSFKKGFLTLRIPNTLIKNHLDETADLIVDFLNKSREQLEDEWF